jgi:uncharacterized protein YndB with AHSA1/START domain
MDDRRDEDPEGAGRGPARPDGAGSDVTGPDAAGSGPAGTATVEDGVDIDAPADEVWEALAAPGGLASWLGDGELDLVPGAVGVLVDPDDGLTREVIVTEVDEGRRIAWHWWPDGGDLSSVEIALEPVGPDTTHVHVIERCAIDGHDRISGVPVEPAWVDPRWPVSGDGPDPLAPRACAGPVGARSLVLAG